jgi:hypothetical protein
MNLLSECSFRIPTHVETSANHLSVDLVKLGPLSNTSCDAIDGYHAICLAAVSLLLLASRPANVTWVVALVVIFPFEGVLETWPRSNIFKKVSEARPPPLAYRNTFSPIPAVGAIISIGASLNHRAPGQVLARDLISSGVSMFQAMPSSFAFHFDYYTLETYLERR